MPSIQSLTMTYDALNEDSTFSEGDTITGKVTLALIKGITVDSFFVKAKGDAEVRWTTKSGDRTNTYTSSRRYFKLKQCFVPEGSKDTVIPRGTHVFKFSIKLPSVSMPSSFKGNHGKIVYRLEAKLSRSWKLDRTVEHKINFVSKCFPNLQSLMSRQVGSRKKEVGLFSKGRLKMDAVIDRRAYAPGETVLIVAKINNDSTKDMTPKFCLTQNVVYRANSGTKHESDTIHKMYDHCITPKTQKEVRCAMKIPHNLMQTIQNCEIISVEYHLKVYLDISFAFDPEIIFPLVIIPRDLAPGFRSGVSVVSYPAEASGGPRNSDFPPSAMAMGYPASPRSGSYRYPAAQHYSPPAPVHSDNQPAYAGPPMYPAQAAYMRGGYNDPMPQRPSPYGSPFSSPSSSVLHPPPTAPPPPTVPTFHPPPSAPPTFNMSPNAPPYSLLPSAPMMNTDFLSQMDEPPPSYSLLFPSSAPENADAK